MPEIASYRLLLSFPLCSFFTTYSTLSPTPPPIPPANQRAAAEGGRVPQQHPLTPGFAATPVLRGGGRPPVLPDVDSSRRQQLHRFLLKLSRNQAGKGQESAAAIARACGQPLPSYRSRSCGVNNQRCFSLCGNHVLSDVVSVHQ